MVGGESGSMERHLFNPCADAGYPLRVETRISAGRLSQCFPKADILALATNHLALILLRFACHRRTSRERAVGPISLFGELRPARKVCQRCLAASFRLTS